MVETHMRYLLPLALLGCQAYPSLEEACNDALPGGDAITDPVDADTALWMNCHRRQARLPQLRIDPALQRSVEAHAVYLETNQPVTDQYYQIPGNEPFTGRTGLERARAEGWTSVNGGRFLELITFERFEAADVLVGRDNFDLWFSNPRVRQLWLQSPAFGFGHVSASYVHTFPEESDLDDIPISLHYWNTVYQIPANAYAQAPIKFPPNGAQDVPARYVHFFDDNILEPGGEYGYPITFTVGVGESSLSVESAALIGPNGPVSITTIDSNNGLTGLNNTAVIVPDDPLAVGQEYTCEVSIKTNLGERRARTTFTVGSRTVGDTLNGVLNQEQARGTGEEPPWLTYEVREGLLTERGPLQAR